MGQLIELGDIHWLPRTVADTQWPKDGWPDWISQPEDDARQGVDENIYWTAVAEYYDSPVYSGIELQVKMNLKIQFEGDYSGHDDGDWGWGMTLAGRVIDRMDDSVLWESERWADWKRFEPYMEGPFGTEKKSRRIEEIQ